MNNPALLEKLMKLGDGGTTYLMSVYDLHPSGIMVFASNQESYREYSLQISEMEVRLAKVLENFNSRECMNAVIHQLPSKSPPQPETCQLTQARVTRHVSSITDLLDSIQLVAFGQTLVLESLIENIRDNKCVYNEDRVDDGNGEFTEFPIADGDSESVQELLVTGLLELCKMKPEGNEAIQWLGRWLIENNPRKDEKGNPAEIDEELVRSIK